ncbi:MAG: sulfotransferase domain-containing protein [Sphingomonas sp.]
MKRYWLASYPKSGNTWLRLLLANIGREEPVSINGFGGSRTGIASARGWFETALHLPSGLLTHAECDALRPLVYASDEMIEEDGQLESSPLGDVSFCKAHDAYVHVADGIPLMRGGASIAGAILIVRDPRDVATSLANHLGRDVDQAIRFMSRPDAALCEATDGQRNQLRQTLLDWGDHARSWLDQSDLPVHLLRYEELHANTERALMEALEFCGIAIDEAEVARSAAFADFGTLRAQEDREGFREAPVFGNDTARFFRSGRVGGWRDELSEQQVRAIESAHAPVMRRLGYELHYAKEHS